MCDSALITWVTSEYDVRKNLYFSHLEIKQKNDKQK